MTDMQSINIDEPMDLTLAQIVGKVWTLRSLCLTPIKHIKRAWENHRANWARWITNPTPITGALLVCRGNDVAFGQPCTKGDRMTKHRLEAKLKYTIPQDRNNHIDPKRRQQHGTEVIALTTEMDVIKQISSTAEHAPCIDPVAVRNVPKSFDAVKQFEWNLPPAVYWATNQQNDRRRYRVRSFGEHVLDYLDAMDASVLFRSGHRVLETG
jgi:hypothetical protein